MKNGSLEEINVTIILTTECNLKCTYCVNNSGEELKLAMGDNRNCRWNSHEDIVDRLSKLSKVRKIGFIKFFGGEPLLEPSLMKNVIASRTKYSPDSSVKFAFTTNGYCLLSDDFLDFLIDNKVILNLSVDGNEQIHNQARLARDGGNSYRSVIHNIDKIRKRKYPFAIISVLDERVVNHDSSISELAVFLKNLSPIYKIEPIYTITCNQKSISYQDVLLSQLRRFVKSAFDSIRNLKQSEYIYENNLFRTIANVVYNRTKEYICSASQFVAIFPDKTTFACYNLDCDDYRISGDILRLTESELDDKLIEMKRKLEISKFPSQYKEIELYGDYCPKENNFESFAYLYRKSMISFVKEELSTISAGSKEHLSLLNYIVLGSEFKYMELVN